MKHNFEFQVIDSIGDGEQPASILPRWANQWVRHSHNDAVRQIAETVGEAREDRGVHDTPTANVSVGVLRSGKDIVNACVIPEEDIQ